MSTTKHVTPEEAHDLFVELECEGYGAVLGLSRQRDLARTVATEPDRTRAAVVKALRDMAQETEWGVAALAAPDRRFSRDEVRASLEAKASRIEAGDDGWIAKASDGVDQP